MIKLFMFVLLGFIAFVTFTSLFLQPDDLKGCSKYPTGQAPCVKADAIVAVSGGDTDARAEAAINLYKNGWANYIIFSGAALDKSGPSNAAVMKSKALAAGISENSIYIDETSETTSQNASNTYSIFTKLNIKSAILVTSGYHQRRASMEFKRNTNGVNIISSPVAEDQYWSKWWWTTTKGWYLASGELIKITLNGFGASR